MRKEGVLCIACLPALKVQLVLHLLRSPSCLILLNPLPPFPGAPSPAPPLHARTTTEQRERQVDRLRVCNSFRELVRIAKEWVNTYSEMPVSVRRLFKHTHLNTACRLLGVSSLSLEFLPERDASLSEGDGDNAGGGGAGGGVGGGAGGWTGAGSKKPLVEDLEAARESHAAQDLADAAAGSTGAGVGATGVPAAGPAPALNGGRGGKTPKQVVEVEVGAETGAETAPRGKGSGAEPEGGKTVPGKPEKLVPFAVLRGPEVEQERWEVCMMYMFLSRRNFLPHPFCTGQLAQHKSRGCDARGVFRFVFFRKTREVTTRTTRQVLRHRRGLVLLRWT